MRPKPPTPVDQKALKQAALKERSARLKWDRSLADLEQAIKQASENGASLRAIANTIGRSHARVRELLQR